MIGSNIRSCDRQLTGELSIKGAKLNLSPHRNYKYPQWSQLSVGLKAQLVIVMMTKPWRSGRAEVRGNEVLSETSRSVHSVSLCMLCN